jgi:hypothetical protein
LEIVLDLSLFLKKFSNSGNILVFKMHFGIFQGKLIYKYLLCRNRSIHSLRGVVVAKDLFRNNIGVRNPFAVAEIKTGKQIDWRNTGAGEKRKIIEQALGASYNEIFNPANTSSALLTPIKSGSGDATKCDEAVIKNYISKWGPNPWGSIYSDEAYGTFGDPVQGAISDCYFMAALSSIAFASSTKALFPKIAGSSFTIKFYDNIKTDAAGVSKPTTSTSIKVTNDHFPLQSNGNLVFARSNTKEEIWPAIYEKAYAAWKSGIVEEPGYAKICQGNPITALANLTNWKYSAASTFDTTAFADNPAKIYDIIAGACNIAPILYPNDRATKWPVVAYTYDSSLLGYSNATIVRNHSYSVLGVQVSGADKYIVLRNPWGQVPPSVIVDPALLDKNRCVLDANGQPIICYGDPNLGTDVLSTKSWMKITDLSSPDDGIFGLHTTAFQKYFQGFGWVFS